MYTNATWRCTHEIFDIIIVVYILYTKTVITTYLITSILRGFAKFVFLIRDNFVGGWVDPSLSRKKELESHPKIVLYTVIYCGVVYNVYHICIRYKSC